MNKIEFSGNLLSPLPVILVGANVENKPNYLVIGYACPFDFGKSVFFSLYKKRYTSQGIHENMTFSVNIPNESLIDKVNLCGTKSGRDIDKSTIFTNYFGVLETAPMIQECSISMECEVSEIVDRELNEGIIGRVVKTYVNDDCIEGDHLEWKKVHPILWGTGGDPNYYSLGDSIDH